MLQNNVKGAHWTGIFQNILIKRSPMKKNKNLLALLSLFANTPVIALRSPDVNAVESRTTTPPPAPNLSESLLMGTGVLTMVAGDITNLYGLYKFFSNINFFTSGEKFADYNKRELAELSKEKLAILVAREEQRKKDKQDGVNKFLTGVACTVIGGVIFLGGTAKYALRTQEETATKIAPSKPLQPVPSNQITQTQLSTIPTA